MNCEIITGNCLDVLPGMVAASVQCCVTSPPYWGLRDYGVEGQLGLEPTPEQYVTSLVAVMREVRRVLRDNGTLWLNLGDCYHSGDRGGWRGDKHRWKNCPMQSQAKGSHMERVSPNRMPQDGLKDKDLVGIPWRVAFALQADGWYLRSDIIWAKPNPMPESVTDRPTKAHEYLFLLSKAARYYYDAEAIKEPAIHAGKVVTNDNGKNAQMGVYGQTRGGFLRPEGVTVADGRNRRSVWTVTTQPYPEAHFATFPPKLIEPCILAGCPVGETVLDPFGGSGTTGEVAERLGRNSILIELNADYVVLAKKRMQQQGMALA